MNGGDYISFARSHFHNSLVRERFIIQVFTMYWRCLRDLVDLEKIPRVQRLLLSVIGPSPNPLVRFAHQIVIALGSITHSIVSDVIFCIYVYTSSSGGRFGECALIA
jgi:hypothetical protein